VEEREGHLRQPAEPVIAVADPRQVRLVGLNGASRYPASAGAISRLDGVQMDMLRRWLDEVYTRNSGRRIRTGRLVVEWVRWDPLAAGS
jgi:hypothetical protein